MNQAFLLPGKWLRWLLDTELFRRMAARPFLTVIFLIVLVLFWSFPSYDVALVLHEVDANWNAVFLQGHSPFTDHADLYPPGSHAAKLTFRFVPAVILGLLSIHSIIGALWFQFITLVLFYVLLCRVLHHLFREGRMVLAYALPICFVITGHVYACDYGGLFDTLAFDFLLAGFLLRRSWMTIPPLLLAYFTDERALIGSGAMLLLYLFQEGTYGSMRSMVKGLVRPVNVLLLASWALYFGLRISLGLAFDLTTVPIDMRAYILGNLRHAPYGLYIGLEGFLVPLILVVTYFIRSGSTSFVIGMCLWFIVLYVVAMSVFDINRSMSYDLFFLLLLLVVLDRTQPREVVLNILGWTILISAVYDDFYPLIPQLYRMHYITHSL